MSAIIDFIGTVLPKRTVIDLLFEGAIDGKHKTKYFLKEITDRYKESINGFNRAMALNIGFAIIALYAYLALPPTGMITIPFVALPISRLVWISLVPLISFGLQTFIITSFVWFMILRLGMKLLNQEVGVNEEFGDATDILLDGAIGHVWIILRIRHSFKSNLNLIWYIPAVTLFLVIMVSPLLMCIYFIVQLFVAKSVVLGIIYSLFFIPYSALFLLLIATASILGMGEFTKSIDSQLSNVKLTIRGVDGHSITVAARTEQEALKLLLEKTEASSKEKTSSETDYSSKPGESSSIKSSITEYNQEEHTEQKQ